MCNTMDKEIVLLVLLGLIVASSTPLRASKKPKTYSSLHLDLIDIHSSSLTTSIFKNMFSITDDSLSADVCQILYPELYRRAFSLQ